MKVAITVLSSNHFNSQSNTTLQQAYLDKRTVLNAPLDTLYDDFGNGLLKARMNSPTVSKLNIKEAMLQVVVQIMA